MPPLTNTRQQSPLRPTLRGFEHVFRFYDAQHMKVQAKILPGEYYVTTSPEEDIVTTLGSCVSACIRDSSAGIGGMNHFMLPGDSPNGTVSRSVEKSVNSYGVFAMESLINEILKLGSGRRSQLEVKVTGGGRIGNGGATVGASNVSFIRRFLEVEGLHPLAVDLGGLHPRKVRYDPISGRLRVKKLACLHDREVEAEEAQYQHSITAAGVAGTVELF